MLQNIYEDLLLRTDIRWLSAGNCLQRFFALRKGILIFLQGKVNYGTGKSNEFLADLAFLRDLTSHPNESTLKLQEIQQNTANLFVRMNRFKNKIKLFKSSLGKKTFFIDAIAEEFENRFSDIKKMEREISVFTQPLTISVENCVICNHILFIKEELKLDWSFSSCCQKNDTGKHVSLQKQLFQHEIYKV